MLNQVIIHGTVAGAPVYTCVDGVDTLRWTLACRRDTKDKLGRLGTDYIQCVAYRSAATYIKHFSADDDPMTVSGRLRITRITDADGEPRSAAEIVVDRAEGYC